MVHHLPRHTKPFNSRHKDSGFKMRWMPLTWRATSGRPRLPPTPDPARAPATTDAPKPGGAPTAAAAAYSLADIVCHVMRCR